MRRSLLSREVCFEPVFCRFFDWGKIANVDVGIPVVRASHALVRNRHHHRAMAYVRPHRDATYHPSAEPASATAKRRREFADVV